MLVTVPARPRPNLTLGFPPDPALAGLGGGPSLGRLFGLGDDLTGGCPSVEQLEGIDDPNDPCQAAVGTTVSGDTIIDSPTSLSPLDTAGDTIVPAAAAATAAASGLPTTPPAGSGLTVAQWSTILAGISSSTAALLKSTQTPYLIPGTNVLYNPATGQVMSAAAVGTTLPAGVTVSTAGLSASASPIFAIGIAVVLAMLLMNSGRSR